MKERPILFSTPMVQARIAGRKTQTRRLLKPQPADHLSPWPSDSSCICWQDFIGNVPYYIDCGYCPYGKPGDRLWVKETHYIAGLGHSECGVGYRADHPTGDLQVTDGGYNFRPFSDDPAIAEGQRAWAEKNIGTDRWKPSIFMPRWASRITLEIEAVRVERLQDISEEDAKAEGAMYHNGGGVGHSGYRHSLGEVYPDAKRSFYSLWDSIHEAHGVAANPWVWVVQFI